MKFKLFLLGCCLALACLDLALAAEATVKIIGFNDFHGNLESPGSFGVQAAGSGTAILDTEAGGADMLAAYVAGLKQENPYSVLVSAGDLIGASPLISALFHDEPTIEIMNRLNLAFNAVGNHEFDKGRAELLRMQRGGCHPGGVNSCKGASVGTPVPFEGAKFKFLAANVIDAFSHKTIFPPYGIKTFKTAQGKVRIAFIGLTLQETPSMVSPAGVKNLHFKDEADTVNALLPRLQAKGVQTIVVLLHQGGLQEPSAASFINDCSATLQNPATSPLKTIVSQLDDAVDLVISGHSHSGFICRLPNKLNRAIPVTQALSYGRVLTDIDMTIDIPSGDVLQVSAKNITVDRNDPHYAADQDIKSLVDHYAGLVAPLANKPVGGISAAISNIADAAGEIVAGDLIADAQLQATAAAESGNAQIALINPGSIRGQGFKAADFPFNLRYGEAFTIQPFGNNLVTMTLTAQQLKDVLEQQFVGEGCMLSDGHSQNRQTVQRIMQVSKGFHVEWSASAAACSKIKNVTLTRYDVSGIAASVDNIVSAGLVKNPARLIG